jgi:hypothetical protein
LQQFIFTEVLSPSVNDDEHPFLIGFDDDFVVVMIEEDEEAYTIDPDSAEALSSDLQKMAQKAREFDS